ncbi:LPS-assembly protein LptD [Candidatus Pelagibacter sp. HIMB1493]|uniref:LPS-assembly protein LptD n=1 Tax=Candidatus Pelagibacter sp. HIMB1493 TaxID=3413334 RepID=UPI003F86F6C2
MKSKNFIILFIFLIFFFANKSFAKDNFTFDVKEIQILENGNKFLGLNKGRVISDSGVIIDADRFEYNKNLNKLKASGNVKVNDTINKYLIFSEEILYDKNSEIIFTIESSKAISIDDDVVITSKNFKYNKKLNIIAANQNVLVKDKGKEIEIYTDFAEFLKTNQQIKTKGNSKAINLKDNSQIISEIFNYDIKNDIIQAENNVKIQNKLNNYIINSNFVTYEIKNEKIYTKGKTTALINSKYNLESEDLSFAKNSMEISSNKKSIIFDKLNLYNLGKFKYNLNKKELKAKKIIITTNFNLPESDKFYFENGIINLNTQNFIANDTRIEIHKNIFGNENNDPRLLGISAVKKDKIIKVNKGIFTNCKKTDDCPPWAIQASEIKHDKNKKQLIYNDAVLKVYDVPVMYFPKFFHPDPSVKRQSGFLKPQINSSNDLGDSIHIPYFHVISKNKDITLKPTIFNNDIKMFQNEYRQKNESSSLIADFSFATGYKSKLDKKEKSLSHLFAKFYSNLKMKDFIRSDLNISLQKVTNDTYLKVFDTNLPDTQLKPESQSNLSNEIDLTLSHDDFYFKIGSKAFEDLNKSNNDRYQYILPYYDFTKNLNINLLDGEMSFASTGSNDYKNTNKVKSSVINDFKFDSNDYVTKFGFINNFNINLKNTNSLGKNDENYKSSPQIELMSLYEFTSERPMQKIQNNFKNILKPKISFRFNPSDMKNYSTSTKTVNVDNIFNIDRFGFEDSFEKGKSLTLGIDFKKERLNDINKYFEFKLASVFRDKEENFIPNSSSLNKKQSNLFGSLESQLSENVTIDYDFRIDNNYDKFEYNSINTIFKISDFETNFNFVKEDGITGDENFFENTTSYRFNNNNYFSFSTRRNRKINLTEFYDLMYEYKNDCLTASIKYKKKYYSDRDLKPSENLLFSLTLFPFTTYEHNETSIFKN